MKIEVAPERDGRVVITILPEEEGVPEVKLAEKEEASPLSLKASLPFRASIKGRGYPRPSPPIALTKAESQLLSFPRRRPP